MKKEILFNNLMNEILEDLKTITKDDSLYIDKGKNIYYEKEKRFIVFPSIENRQTCDLYDLYIAISEKEEDIQEFQGLNKKEVINKVVILLKS